METIRCWTRQNIAVLETIEKTGRHVAVKEKVLQWDDARLMKPAYDWLACTMPQAGRPPDADYPIWLIFNQKGVQTGSSDSCILELEISPSLVTKIPVSLWGMVNNFSYIPIDTADALRHRKKMESLGISDAKACMSQFYPELRAEIEDSWLRIYDRNYDMKDLRYGLIWEVRAEWIRNVLR